MPGRLATVRHVEAQGRWEERLFWVVAAPDVLVLVEELRWWIDAGVYDRRVVEDASQFSQGAGHTVREWLFLRARAIAHQGPSARGQFFGAYGAPKTVTFGGRDGLFGSLRKRFTAKRPAPRQEATAAVPLQGVVDDDDVDAGALLLAGQRSMWLSAKEHGGA